MPAVWIERLNRCAGRIPLGVFSAVDPGMRRGETPPAVEILHWAYSPHLPDNVPHRHTYFEVCRVGQWGRGEFRVQGIPHVLEPGMLFFARPGVIHQIVNTASPLMELFWVSFSLVLPPQSAAAPGEVESLLRSLEAADMPVAFDTGGRVGTLWDTLRTFADSLPPTGNGGNTQLAALSSALVLALAQAGSVGREAPSGPSLQPGDSDRSARLAVRYIHDNLSNPDLSVSEVAAHLHVSPRHLARLLHAFTGVAPGTYIAQARWDRAAVLLVQTDTPLKQVALQSGYRDVQHFTRAFGRVGGVTPGVFRQTGTLPARVAGPNNTGALV